MYKIILILFIALFVFNGVLFAEKKKDFRQNNFGDTREEILKNEKSKILYKDYKIIIYYDTFRNVSIIYYFIDNKFVMSSYYYIIVFKDSQEGLSYFLKKQKKIINKYGLDILNLFIFENKKYEKKYCKNYDMWDELIFAGRLSLVTIWGNLKKIYVEIVIVKKRGNVIVYEKYVSKKYMKLILDKLYNRKNI